MTKTLFSRTDTIDGVGVYRSEPMGPQQDIAAQVWRSEAGVWHYELVRLASGKTLPCWSTFSSRWDAQRAAVDYVIERVQGRQPIMVAARVWNLGSPASVLVGTGYSEQLVIAPAAPSVLG